MTHNSYQVAKYPKSIRMSFKQQRMTASQWHYIYEDCPPSVRVLLDEIGKIDPKQGFITCDKMYGAFFIDFRWGNSMCNICAIRDLSYVVTHSPLGTATISFADPELITKTIQVLNKTIELLLEQQEMLDRETIQRYHHE